MLKFVSIAIDSVIIEGGDTADTRQLEMVRRISDRALDCLLITHPVVAVRDDRNPQVRNSSAKYKVVAGHATFRLARAIRDATETVPMFVLPATHDLHDLVEVAEMMFGHILAGASVVPGIAQWTELLARTKAASLGRDLDKVAVRNRLLGIQSRRRRRENETEVAE